MPSQVAWFGLLGLGLTLAGCGGDRVDGLGPDPSKPGTLVVTVEGLPEPGAASVRVTGPGGFSRGLTATETIGNLPAGTYQVTASDVAVNGDSYQAGPTLQSAAVKSGQSAAVRVSHTIATGRIGLSISGVTPGNANVVVVGPDGTSRTVTGPEVLTGLPAGTYLVHPEPVVVDGDRWAASVDSQLVLVTPGTAPSPAVVDYQLASGRVLLTVSGAPSGTTPTVTLEGPDGFSVAAAASTLLKGLPPGSYALSGSELESGGHRYFPTYSAPNVMVSATLEAVTAEVDYQVSTGALAVVLTGLPPGVAGGVEVTGPNGYHAAITKADTLTGLTPGSYLIGAANVVAAGALYRPLPASQPAVIGASVAPVVRTVAYALGVGTLDLSVSGLPIGVPAEVAVTGPNGYAQNFSGSATVAGLAPGLYAVLPAPVGSGWQVYQGAPLTQAVTIGVDLTTPAQVTYAPTVGSLAVTIGGLPGGTNAAVTVSGPGGFTQIVTGSLTLTGLAPGSYQVAAAAVSSGGQAYNPTPATKTAAVIAGNQATATVTYAGTLGGLLVTITGLPGGALAAVTVTGPGGFVQTVAATQTLTGLVSGNYTIAAATVSSGGYSYLPSPATQVAAVAAGATTAGTVVHTATGNLAITINGLPGGVLGAVSVTGPGGYSRAVTVTETLTGLVGGTYTVAAATVSSGGTTYTAAAASQTALVVGAATVSRTVTYTPATGGLAVTIAGLPGGALAAVSVTGPGGFSQGVTASVVLSGLVPGSYTITASSVFSGGNYLPTPTSQTVAVANGSTAAATVTYTLSTGVSLNLTIAGMYLTQGTARYDGTTKVVGGRDGYLRVFVQANQANTVAPSVRVRFYAGASLIQTSTIAAPGGSVPTAVTEGSLASSWNLAVPGTLVVANLRILADVDPTNVVAEANDADNSYPATGTPFVLDVRTVPTFNIRMVPVLQSVNGLQGDVTGGNIPTFLIDPLKLLPIVNYSTALRAVYTTNAPALESGNGNSAWGTILSEVNSLKFADGNSSEYYYGVVKTSYGSGVAGIGYVGGGARTAVGWDRLPSGSGVMAHELGHNMSMSHAPCGGPASPDPSYPYAGGVIGVWGLDLTTLALKDPTTIKDFMTYCNPDWVSDYAWNKMIGYRESNPSYAPPAPSSATAGLLVWGRITSAGIVLEPAFRVAAPNTAPRGGGRYRVQVLAADGGTLAEYSVEPILVSNENEVEYHFAAVLPLDARADGAMARVRLVTPAGPQPERASRQALAQGGGPLFYQDPAASVTSASATQARLTWDAATYPMAMVRDAATGQVLSFARGGAINLWTRSREFEVTFSDGVRSFVRRLQ